MKITNIDHTVLTVKDIETTVKFYKSVLGMSIETFGNGRVALKFGNQKINLHKQYSEFEPKANRPVPGSGDLCFITKTKLEVAMEHVISQGVDILEGPLGAVVIEANVSPGLQGLNSVSTIDVPDQIARFFHRPVKCGQGRHHSLSRKLRLHVVTQQK